MQLTYDQISTQAMEPQPARSAATRGRTYRRRATPLSLYSGIRHDESQSPLPLYKSLTGPGREVFVIETSGPGDPVSTSKATTAAQSARPDSRNRMVLPEASLGEATRSVPKGSPLGSSRVPTHSTDVRIVFALAGGGEAKIYGNAEVAGRSLEYEHHAAL